MDHIGQYREIIKQLLPTYAQFKPSYGEIDTEVIFDEVRDHYELMHVGWKGATRIHGSVIHIDIRQGKVWIQHDGTERGIAEELVESGIPRDQIVLAFHPPEMRPHTRFAVV
jgi:ketopantoate reductase